MTCCSLAFPFGKPCGMIISRLPLMMLSSPTCLLLGCPAYLPARWLPPPPPVCRSEPEVQVLLSLAKELKPHVWLNVHSGMYALFTPYDHKGHVPNTTGTNMAGICCHIFGCSSAGPTLF